MKEQLVTQLKAQVTDLKRLIEFLQGPAEKKCQCSESTKSGSKHINHDHRGTRENASASKPLQLKEKNVINYIKLNIYVDRNL